MRSSFSIFRPCILLALVFVFAPAVTAQTLSDPAVDTYNCRMSSIMIGGKYQFTTNSILVEGAMVLTNLGVNSYKFTMKKDGANYTTVPATVTNLMMLARDVAAYRSVFDMPTLKHYVFWCYTFKNSENYTWNNTFTPTEQTNEYNEIYGLAQYFLTNYNNSGKSFYLGHWEGDWSIGLSTLNTASSNPSPTAIQNMIDWLNTRQKAVDDAMNSTPHTNVSVFNYTEVNRVVDTTNVATIYTNRVINCVVPYVTNLDYVSWSSYDIQNKTNVAWWLDYANSFIPTNKASKISGKRLFIGEFGWGSKTEDQQAPLIQAYDRTLFSWGCPFSFYWEIYDNNINYTTNGTTIITNYEHFDLIYTNGLPTANYWLYANYWNAIRLQLLAFKQQNNRLPTDAEFNVMSAALLDSSSPLPMPVNLTVTGGAALVTGHASAILSGTVAQGVYGETLANVRIYWGPSDGGTNIDAWANVIDLGTNSPLVGTNSFAQVVANLPADYYYRYYATNSGGDAWSAASLHVSLKLNPQEYGSRLKVTFAGYNRNETLTNFPVLIRLSTNLTGFAYSQFGSPLGGDLRVTDASGEWMVPHEIDEWSTNGTSLIWAQVPALSGTNDFIWLYWGNAAATNLLDWSTNGLVWSPDHELAWHLKETNFPYADSVQNYSGISGNAPILTNGYIGKGVRLDGSRQYISPGTVSLNNAFTLSAWVNVTSNNSYQTIWASKAGSTNTGFALCVNSYNKNDQSLVLETGDGTNFTKAYTGTNLVTFGQWHLINAVIDKVAGTANLYVDGTNQTMVNSIRSALGTQQPVYLGRWATNSTYAYYFKGLVDEARIESVARSSNWIWACYQSGVSNSAFLAYTNVVRNLPTLAMATAGAGAKGGWLFTWPAGVVGYALYSATNLVSAAWSPVTNVPVMVNYNNVTQWQVSLPASTNAARYYKLMAP